VKTRVYFLRIHVIAPRCCFLANLEDPRLLRLPNERLFRLKMRFFLKTMCIFFFNYYKTLI